MSPIMPRRNRSVSILARPGGRALLTARLSDYAATLFQSSPAPEGGRYKPKLSGPNNRSRVSILARPGGRALLKKNNNNNI